MSSRDERLRWLADCENQTAKLDPSQVEFDFSTDSWSQLQLPFMRARKANLHARAPCARQNIQQVLAKRFPFQHFIVTPRGRDAEGLLFAAMAGTGFVVIQNILFHTARGHQLACGLIPAEAPHQAAFSADDYPFKADLDLDKVATLLRERRVGLIFVEAVSNGVGGHALSMANLRAVHALAHAHAVPLLIDATRAVENCLFIQSFEDEFKEYDLASIMQEFLACCDGATLSFCKDYGLTVGGLLATNSEELWQCANAAAQDQTLIVDEAEQALIALGLSDAEFAETQVRLRRQQLGQLHDVLVQLGFPVRLTQGGHCVILDLALLPDKHDVQDYLARLYVQTGMRGSLHWSGLAVDYQRPDWIRLAIPLAYPPIAREKLVASLSGFSPAGAE